jgi:GT2 family glycosyltransferase
MATISVVIVSYKVRNLLRKCLRSVFASETNFLLEVWVVDNDSGDGSAELVQTEFPQVRLIANTENKGFAVAANQALRQARGEFLLLLNPDAELMEHSLAELVDCLERNPDVGVVGGAIVNPDGAIDPASHRGLPLPSAMVAKALGLDRLFPNNRLLAQYNLRWLPLDQEAEVVAVSGSFMVIRQAVVEAIGLLDERFFLYFEDGDYCVRARDAGWKVWYDPRASVRHEKHASSRHSPAQARLALYRSYLAYCDKHWPNWRLKRVFVRLLVYVHSGFDRRVFLPRTTA